MKNTFFAVLAALFFTLSAGAQSTVDSIEAKYQLLPMPEPLTLEKTFPVIGSYQLASQESENYITITLDENNKGIIWVDGLPEGRFRAYLKSSPATYRIISQKSESGKQIAEGTLIFDRETQTLNIAMGGKFNDEDPASVFIPSSVEESATTQVKAKGKAPAKPKIIFYTASRADQSTTSL